MTERRYDCVGCGADLPEGARSDRLYCSARCRMNAYRAAGAPKTADMTCELCGAPFRPLRGKQRVCAKPEQTSATCRDMQAERERQRTAVRLALDEERWEKACEHCGENTGWEGAGRPRRFCSSRCKTAFYRAAKKA